MDPTLALVSNKKLVCKTLPATLPLTVATFPTVASCVCLLCKKGVKKGGCTIVSETETFCCFQNVEYATKGAVHVFHEWCLSEFIDQGIKRKKKEKRGLERRRKGTAQW